jgi:hypothetical protein
LLDWKNKANSKPITGHVKAKTNPIQSQFRKVNGLDNNLRNCYIDSSKSYMLKKILE